MPLKQHGPVAQVVASFVRHQGIRAWLVGGTVRDELLGIQSHDVDIAVDGDVIAAAGVLAEQTGWRLIVLDSAHPTVRLVPMGSPDGQAGATIDLVQLRAATITADLGLRDFTINALAVPLTAVGWDTGEILDPTGGRADLAAGLLRVCGPTSITDDPLRMLRAVRLAAQFGFVLAAGLQAEIESHHRLLAVVASERIRDELLRLLALPHATRWLVALDQLRLLTTIIPELEPARACDQPGGHHYFPVLEHMIEAVRVWEWIKESTTSEVGEKPVDPPAAVAAHPELGVGLAFRTELTERMAAIVDGVPRTALFKLALLTHDIAKPQTKALKPDGSASFYDHQAVGAVVMGDVAQRLRLSRSAAGYIQTVVREHMRPGQLADGGNLPSRRAIYRFFTATGDAGPEVLVHLLCDYMAMRGPALLPARWEGSVQWVNQMLHQFYDVPETVRPQLLVNGRDVMEALGLAPGPAVGRLTALILEAQASGEVTSREEAIALARRTMGEAQQTEDQAENAAVRPGL